MIQLEAEVCRIEIDGALHVSDLIADAVAPDDQAFIPPSLIGGQFAIPSKKVRVGVPTPIRPTG